jgi:TonB family protein
MAIRQNLKNKKKNNNFEESSWVLYFSLSSWLIGSLLFFTGIYKSLLLSMDKKFQEEKQYDSKVIHMLIDQKEKTEILKDETIKYLSDKETEASGDFTKKKGFENFSESREFKIESSKKKKPADDKAVKGIADSEKKNENFQLLDNRFTAKIVHTVKKVIKNIIPIQDDAEETTLPQSFDFKKEFVFSWDVTGRPIIPSVYQKHFKYYKEMLDKIQSNWAPPGGTPFPIFDNSIGSSYYIPGRSTYQTFPEQDIRVLFSLDNQGNVIETKLWGSIGYESLDRSCIDAIEKSKNFGPPPGELLNDKDQFVMPLEFRIIGFETNP